MTSRSHVPEHPRRLAGRPSPACVDLDGVVAEVGQPQVAQQQPAVGVRVGAHPSRRRRARAPEARVTVGRPRRTARPGGRTAATPRAGPGAPGSCRTSDSGTWCERHVPSVGRPSTSFGPVQPFGVRRTIIGQVGRSVDPATRRRLDRRRPRPGPRPSSAAISAWTVIGSSPPTNRGRVPVALEQRGQLLVADAVEDRRVGDLVAVEGEDRDDRPVDRRVEELVRVPARGQRSGLRLAVADDAEDDEVAGCRTPPRRRGRARSPARRPRGSSPGVSGVTWLPMPPGNENWRNRRCIPSSSQGQRRDRPRRRCPRGRRWRRPPGRRARARRSRSRRGRGP